MSKTLKHKIDKYGFQKVLEVLKKVQKQLIKDLSSTEYNKEGLNKNEPNEERNAEFTTPK